MSNETPKLISLENLGRFKTDLENTYDTPRNPAKLDENSKIKVSQIPEDALNVEEYASFASFPSTGKDKRVYVDKSSNTLFRWNGSNYVSLSSSDAVKYTANQGLNETQKLNARQNIGAIASDALPTKTSDLINDSGFITEASVPDVSHKADLGADGKLVSSQLPLGNSSLSAYPGDKGNVAYIHATDASRSTTAKASGLYKIATTAEGHVASVTAVIKEDITALDIPGQDTTYENKSASQDGTDVSLVTTGEKYIWNNKANVSDIPDISHKADLDSNGKVVSSQLPSYVDDVLEFYSPAQFPIPGESGKIYVSTSTNITYRWTGSTYVAIGSDLALGETESTAYRGDRGKVAYDHATAKGTSYSSGLYKITTNAEGHVTSASNVIKSDITALGIPGQDTTYENKQAVSGGSDVSLVTTGEKYVWNNKAEASDIPDISGKADLVNGKLDKTQLPLGEDSDTAYRGDRGKAAYDHASASGSAFAQGLYKITTNSEGHVTAATAVIKEDITALGIPGQDTTYESKTATESGTDVSLVTTGEKYTWNHKADVSDIPDISGKADLDTNGKLVTNQLPLGETATTAYQGDKGKTAYDHATDASRLTTAQTSGLYKIATTAEGHIASTSTVVKEDITALGIPGQDTTYESKAAAEEGTDVSLVTTGEKYIWNNKADAGDIPSGVVQYTPQSLTVEQKSQARTNIDAASNTEFQGVSNTVTQLNNKINNFGNFVREVNEAEGGIEVVYDNNQVEEIPTGLVFDGGVVDENNYLYLKKGETVLSEDVFTPIYIPAGGGGGGASINITNISVTKTARNGESAPFSFVATSSDASNITVKWYVNDVLYSTEYHDSGEEFSFDAGPYLTPSSESTVKAAVENEGGVTLQPKRWTVKTVAYALSWGNSISSIMLFTTQDNVYAPINVSAEANSSNVVEVTVNNHTITRNVTGSQTLTVEIDKSYFITGTNVVTAGMHAADDPTDKAKDIQFTVVWAYQATTPIVAFAESAIECTQYDIVNIEYFVFDPDNEIATHTIQVGAGEPKVLTANRSIQRYQYSPLEPETVTITLRCKEVSTTTTLTATQSPYKLDYYSDDSLRYNLDPVGHSNQDADREQFAGLTFSENFDWENGGFITDENGAPAFVVKKGNYVTLPRSLFADSDANGKTMDISFKIRNSEQYGAVAIRDLNQGSTRGILLHANNGEIMMDNVVGKAFRYCEEGRIDLSILVETADEQRIVTVWLDGIPSKVEKYSAGMLVHNEEPMMVGSEHCDVWLYGIRAYNAALSKKQMIQNYVSEGNTTEEKVRRYQLNTILDENDKVTVNALHTVVPELTIVQISAPRMTTSKEDPVPANITITDGGSTLELLASENVVFKVQGTSSASYGRSSYNMDIDFSKTDKTYKISENAIPVNYLNIKVNVASSENANNINAVDWYNTFQPYLTVSRQTPGVRDTVEGKPCAVFITNTNDTAVWFSSQFVQPGETILYAMGDLCNSKKNKAVFGQDSKGEHCTKACIEVSGNDYEPERFRSTDAVFNPAADDGKGRWEIDNPDEPGKKLKVFEWRMNPKSANLDEVVGSWNETVAWVVSTIGNSAKFKNEVGQYFAIESLLYHFLFIEYFAGYDNVSKNTFYSYDWDEDAQKYLWNIKAAYDMDTILACDNDGKPFGDYGLDYGDTEGGRSYFNAADNTIWCNIQEAFQDELSTLYRSLRSNGAWDSSAMEAKWNTYQNKRPRVTMMLDAYYKYVLPYKTSGMVIDGETKSYDDNYLPRMQGSKIYWRKQFLTYQTSYMDGKYGYYSKSNSTQFRTNCESGTRTFATKVYAKTYITLLSDDNKVASKKIEAGQEASFTNVSVGSNTTLYFTPDKLIQYIRPLNDTDNSTFSASGAAKLMEVILGGETPNTSWPAGTGVSIPSILLKDFSIRNLPYFSDPVNLSNNVELETLDTRGTNAGITTLPTSAPIRTMYLNACTGVRAFNLKKVQTFTMESGNNLTSVRVENCNAVMNTATATYVKQATEVQQAATRRIRVIMDNTPDVYDATSSYSIGDACVYDGQKYTCNTDIPEGGEEWNSSHWTLDPLASKANWNFDNLDVLYKIATAWKGYNALGEDQDLPYVAGTVHVASLSEKKLEAIHNVWGEGPFEDSFDEEHKRWTSPNLTILYDATIPYFNVTFLNRDNTPIKDKQGNNYVQYIDLGGEAYDPIAAGEVNTPTYEDQTGQYYYTFTNWLNLEGIVNADKNVTANYSRELITYTVTWWDKQNGTIWDKRENVPYGSEAVYDPDGTIGFPTLTDQEIAGIYKVFAGWNKSTGYIRGNIDVYANWETGAMPQPGETDLSEMNVAQIYGIAKNKRASEFFEDGDYTDIQVGKDFNFSNVTSEVLLEDRYFDGTSVLKFDDIKLFSADAPTFTMAIDYEFTAETSGATLVSCCNPDTLDGVRVKYSTSSSTPSAVTVEWGDKTNVVAHGMNRGVLILKHVQGSKSLFIASDNGGRYINRSSSYGGDATQMDIYAGYSTNAYYAEVPRTLSTETDAVLCFGGIPYESTFLNPAKGWIYSCKIWYDDLGRHNMEEMANWPHETWRMHYRGSNITAYAGQDNASFVANAPLPQFYEMYPTSQTDTRGGWANSIMRTFINNRCFHALPYSWQAILRTTRLVTKGGADAPTSQVITNDKMYIPSLRDLTDTTSYDYEGQQISWMLTNNDRKKYMGIPVPIGKQSIDSVDDPTLYTSTYNVQEGDIWHRLAGYDSTEMYFIYYTDATIAKHGFLGGRPTSDTTSNVPAAGAQGGVWVRAISYWTRTNQAQAGGNYQWHSIVNAKGAIESTYVGSAWYQEYGIVLMFSI